MSTRIQADGKLQQIDAPFFFFLILQLYCNTDFFFFNFAKQIDAP